jgi:hypothetical protein
LACGTAAAGGTIGRMSNERAISQRQAWRCEQALEIRCRCRCAGLLHGARRMQHPQGLYMLPAEDPHRIEWEDKTSKLGPMRRVVSKEVHKYSSSWVREAKRFRMLLKLECGHSVWRKRSKAKGRWTLRKVHCEICGRFFAKSAELQAARHSS